MSASAQLSERLFERLVEFNFHVERIAHPSWLPQALQPVVYGPQARLHPRAERAVSEWLLEEHDLRGQMDWQMDEHEKRVWLLDSASLSRLALELSAVLHREWLVRVIDGVLLRKWQRQVDSELLQLLVDCVPDYALRHETPQASFTLDAADQLGASLRADGSRVLLALLDPKCRAVYGRARLRLDAQSTGGGLELTDDARESLIHLMSAWLIPQRFAQWRWLF